MYFLARGREKAFLWRVALCDFRLAGRMLPLLWHFVRTCLASPRETDSGPELAT